MAIPFEPAEIIRSLGKALREEVDLVSATFVRAVVPATPVDTGHARRNWQLNTPAPNGQEIPGVDKSGTGTVANALSRLKASANRNPFALVVIENNVPYIGALNEGKSRQAPALFVELALASAVKKGANTRVDL